MSHNRSCQAVVSQLRFWLHPLPISRFRTLECWLFFLAQRQLQSFGRFWQSSMASTSSEKSTAYRGFCSWTIEYCYNLVPYCNSLGKTYHEQIYISILCMQLDWNHRTFCRSGTNHCTCFVQYIHCVWQEFTRYFCIYVQNGMDLRTWLFVGQTYNLLLSRCNQHVLYWTLIYLV